jgi:hypothetical protein
MPNITDHQLKRLDHLQAIIQRLAGNSFLIKGWTLTLVSAILGFALKDTNNPHLAYLAVLPTFAFWGLDGYYLALEIGMRGIYNTGARELAAKKYPDQANDLPSPTIEPDRFSLCGWLCATLRPATATIYVVQIICAYLAGRGVLGH